MTDKTQLDRIEDLVGRRVYSWHDQVAVRYGCHGRPGDLSGSSLCAEPTVAHLYLTDTDATKLRDHLILTYGYPDVVLVSVGNPGPYHGHDA